MGFSLISQQNNHKKKNPFLSNWLPLDSEAVSVPSLVSSHVQAAEAGYSHNPPYTTQPGGELVPRLNEANPLKLQSKIRQLEMTFSSQRLVEMLPSILQEVQDTKTNKKQVYLK